MNDVYKLIEVVSANHLSSTRMKDFFLNFQKQSLSLASQKEILSVNDIDQLVSMLKCLVNEKIFMIDPLGN